MPKFLDIDQPLAEVANEMLVVGVGSSIVYLVWWLLYAICFKLGLGRKYLRQIGKGTARHD